jgi:glycerol-3-phosphate dehydrogenase
LKKTEFGLLIISDGITGADIILDTTSLGMKIALIKKNILLLALLVSLQN